MAFMYYQILIMLMLQKIIRIYIMSLLTLFMYKEVSNYGEFLWRT
nr:MAG TPA: hypothetical protein [Caudoviricetes sp.]